MTTVLVTGASGFIAKHIVRDLLEHGHAVRATVRSERRRAEVHALFPDAPVEYVSLDLAADEGWREALEGVDVLIHTASPFPGAQPKDPQEIIRPAVDGTLRALQAAQAAGVSRVVLTSTVGAIYKPAGAGATTRVKTRDDWTDPDGSHTTAYEASKTLAERAAWDFVAKHPQMRLTTINPGMVFGPAMDANFGTSLQLVEDIMDRKFPMYPRMQMPVVDVRDVARAHVAAMDDDAAVGLRFPLNAGAMHFREIGETLAERYPDAKIPTRIAPDWLIRAMALFSPVMKTAAKGIGTTADVDGADAPRQFGFTYIPSRDALLAAAEFIRAMRSTQG